MVVLFAAVRLKKDWNFVSIKKSISFFLFCQGFNTSQMNDNLFAMSWVPPLWTISLDHAVAFLGIFLHWTTLWQRLGTAPKKGNGRRLGPRTTDTQWRHKSKKSKNLGRCGRQNMLPLYLKIWEWELIFSYAVKAISSPGVRSPWLGQKMLKINRINQFH